MAAEKQIHQVGRRKTAVARVYFRPRSSETGQIRVNNRPLKEYFTRETAQRLVVKPLELTSTMGQYDVHVNVRGGGISGQAGAVQHGISRSLLKVDATFRPALKKAGLLTRDDREVERKKYGLAGARRRYQYSKR